MNKEGLGERGGGSAAAVSPRIARVLSFVGGSHETGCGIVPFRVWKMLMSSLTALRVLAKKERSARDGNRGEVRQFADGSADRLPSVDVIMIPRDLT